MNVPWPRVARGFGAHEIGPTRFLSGTPTVIKSVSGGQLRRQNLNNMTDRLQKPIVFLYLHVM